MAPYHQCLTLVFTPRGTIPSLRRVLAIIPRAAGLLEIRIIAIKGDILNQIRECHNKMCLLIATSIPPIYIHDFSNVRD